MRKTLAILTVLAGFLPAVAAAQAPPAVPALPDTERRTSYALSAGTCPACSVGFALYGDGTDYGTWLELWIVTGSGTTTTATKLTPVTDWTLSSVSGSLATLPRPITNATITLTAPRTGTLQIVGAKRPRRLSQFAENRGVAARDLNVVVTDLVAENRELFDKMGRALITAPGDTIGTLPATAQRAGGVLGFDSSGNPTAITALTGLGNVIGPNISVVGHIATFGNSSGTLLLDGGLVGAGDMVGPGSSAANHAVTFLDALGKNTKDSGVTITPSTGTLTLATGKTLTASNSLTLAGTDGTTLTFQATGTVVNRDSTDTLTNKTLTSPTINTATITGATLSGGTISGPTAMTITDLALFLQDNVTPTKQFQFQLSSISAATTRTWTVPDVNSTFVGTDNAQTLTNKIFDTASNTFSINGLAATVNTGTGAVVRATSPALVTPDLGVATATSINKVALTAPATSATLTIANGKTLTASNTLTFTGTDGTSFAFPGTSDTVAVVAGAQTLTNKTLTAPTISGGTHTALTSLGIRSSGTGAFDISLVNTENLSAGRNLTLTLNNANRTLDLSGNLTLSATLTTAGGTAITLTSTGTTNVTLPTSGTLATRDTSNTFSSTNTFSALTQLTDIKLSSGKIYPTADSTTAVQLCKADGTTCVARLDTTNARLGINKTPGAFDLDVNGAVNVGGTLTFTTLDAASLSASTSTITGLSINNSPNSSNDYLIYYNAASGGIRRCTVGACAAAATAGVSALNGLTGSLTVTSGGGISVASSGSSITITGASIPQGRLTTNTNVPVVTASQVGAVVVFYTAYTGRTIPIYNGTSMDLWPMCAVNTVGTCELSVVLGSNWAANSAFDVYATVSAGSPVLCTVAWTNTTTRATTPSIINGILTNGNTTPTCRTSNTTTTTPAAYTATYLGSFYTNANAGQVDYVLGGADTAASLGICNYYNRVNTQAQVTDSGSNYTYTSNTVRQKRGSANYQIKFMNCMQEDATSAIMTESINTVAAANARALWGVGLDSTTTYVPGARSVCNTNAAAIQQCIQPASGFIMAGIGVHTLSANESSDNVNANQYNAVIAAALTAVIRN